MVVGFAADSLNDRLGLEGVSPPKPPFEAGVPYESLFYAECATKLFEGVKLEVASGGARAIVSCGLFLAGFIATLFLRPERAGFTGFVGGFATDFPWPSFPVAVGYLSSAFGKNPVNPRALFAP